MGKQPAPIAEADIKRANVTPEQFANIARMSGWRESTIRCLFLERLPDWPVLVGDTLYSIHEGVLAVVAAA